MTDNQQRTDNGRPTPERPQTIVVPGHVPSAEMLSDEELLTEAQQVQDLGAASRSCVAIIVVLLFVALLICVFLMWAFFLQ